MGMTRYNKSLDYAALALAAAANGDHSTAGKLLLEASKAPDVGRAVQILEASNAQAYDAERAQVRASAKGGAKRAASKTTAKTQVKAFDIGDEDEINDLIGEGVEAADEEFEVDEDDEDEDNDADVSDSEFAAVLAGMMAQGKKAK